MKATDNTMSLLTEAELRVIIADAEDTLEIAVDECAGPEETVWLMTVAASARLELARRMAAELSWAGLRPAAGKAA